MEKEKVLKMLLDIIEEANKKGGSWGATLDKNGQPVSYKNGFQVSYKDGPQTEKLEEAAAAVLNGFNGLWYDRGIWYIDKSMHIIEREKAIRFGLDKKQKSILNWSNMEYIWLN